MNDSPNIHPSSPDSIDKVAAEMAAYIRSRVDRMADGKFRVLQSDIAVGRSLVKRYGELALEAAQQNARD